MPATNITHLTGKVTYPALMKMRGNQSDAVSFYLKVFRYLSIMIIPLGIGTIALIEPFFHLFFGDKWDAAILPTQLLAVFGMLRGLFSNIGYLFIMLDRVREMTMLLSAQLVLLLSLIYPATVRYELAGVCLLLLVLNLLVSIAGTVRLRVFFPGFIGAHVRRMLLPLFLSAVSFVGPRAIFEIFSLEVSFLSFSSLVAISVVLYCSITLLTNRKIIVEMKSFYASVILSDG
jgi:O-antigen/teichoic acid export membrane protein